MNNEEVLKLAEECGVFDLEDAKLYAEELEAFYRAAFNAGLAAAVKATLNVARDWRATEHVASECADAISDLEMKP